MIIVRPELTRRITSGSWVMVYGRRKTGKTFLVKQFQRYDRFYFVGRDRTILEEDMTQVPYDVFIDRLRRDLKDDRTVVVDEFHRLGEGFLDILHAMDMKGKLILISSTLHLSRTLLSGSSPLIGKVQEVKVPPVDFIDLLASTRWRGKGRYEMLAFMKEPMVIALGYNDPVDTIIGSALTVSALIGEIFTEENRKLSEIYESVLRSVAVGRSTSGEMSSFAFYRKLIRKDDPSLLQQYIRNLCDLGILRKYNVWGRKRFVFRHVSPLMSAYYSIDERYGISNREMTVDEGRSIMDQIVPRVMEDVLRDCLADRLGAVPHLDMSPSGEVDGILVRFNKPKAVVEVKWKKRLDRKDLSTVEKNLERYPDLRKVLIVPDRDMVSIDGIEIIEPLDILEFS